MPTISQGLSIPAQLITGGLADAPQITPLYNALNAFVIPANLLVWNQAFISDNLIILTIGGTVTQDYTFTTTIPQGKSTFLYQPFSWSGAGAPGLSVQFRFNTTAITAARVLSNSATGNGIFVGFIGATHDADIPRPVMFLMLDDGGTFSAQPANAGMPTADLTSFGITISGGGGTGAMKLKSVRVWGEG